MNQKILLTGPKPRVLGSVAKDAEAKEKLSQTWQVAANLRETQALASPQLRVIKGPRIGFGGPMLTSIRKVKDLWHPGAIDPTCDSPRSLNRPHFLAASFCHRVNSLN